ncbi:hypothetical protein HD592_000140 [Schaalia hyovaginalis]|uniref:Uncharacterized protein n=1 Tax=Schaalia hyovaginalis TaxID=29316 RepID=A0A923IWY7_9ACTO|nr:hypothetical protein [Schaalia hyovaginalis]
MRVLPAAVRGRGLLGEEVLPPHAPRHIVLNPHGRLFAILHVKQPRANLVELARTRQFRPRGSGLFDDPEHVEGAPLNPSVRPRFLSGLLKAAPPIRHHHDRRRDPVHEGLPRTRVLTPCDIPAQHMLSCLGDQHDRFTPQVQAVNEDDLVDLIHDRRQGPDLPQTLTAPTKRPATTWHVRLPGPTKQPREEVVQMLRGGVNPLHAR